MWCAHAARGCPKIPHAPCGCVKSEKKTLPEPEIPEKVSSVMRWDLFIRINTCCFYLFPPLSLSAFLHLLRTDQWSDLKRWVALVDCTKKKRKEKKRELVFLFLWLVNIINICRRGHESFNKLRNPQISRGICEPGLIITLMLLLTATIKLPVTQTAVKSVLLAY